MTYYLVAFTLGLTGSLHCVGMCAPLMLAAGEKGWWATLLYQAGRITTYVVLGTLVGSFGLGLRLWNAQSSLAILSGSLLVVFALLRFDPGRYLYRWPVYQRFQLRLRAYLGRNLHQGGMAAQFGLGLGNGLVPCGLVYLAVMGSAGAAAPLAGAGFMLAFGLGTLPLLLVTLYAGRKLVRVAPARIAALTPVVMAAMGLFLIWRGWNARIPLSFHQFQDLVFPPMCH